MNTQAMSAPAARRSFVGREREIEQIERTFAAGAQLVTLTGPAGTGKTRLAERFVELHRDDGSREATWFCGLAEVEGSADLCATLARVLGVPVAPRDVDHAAETIGRTLADRGRALVVLDNLEHLVDDVVPLLAFWRDEAPEIEFLVTSQERLRLADEHCIPLAPLPVPPAGVSDAERVLAFDAPRLFLERARLVDPGFVWDESAAKRVAAITRNLDGIPLAIELAAARVGMLGLTDLNRLLERRFEVLVAEQAGLARRHATLRSAIDWSWDLLAPEQQQALCQCAVFRGGFSLDSFRGVVLRGEPLGGLETLQALHDKSFLTTSSPSAFPGERRYALYESIRAYLREKLAERGELGPAERRHADYFLAVSEEWQGAIDGPRGAEARNRLLLERENLLAVYERGLARRSRRGLEQAVRAVLPLEVAFAMSGPFDRYVSLLDAALASARSAALPAELVARAHASRGRMHVVQGRFGEAVHDFEQALEHSERAGDARLGALCALKAGQASAIEGRGAEAAEHFARVRRHLEEHPDPRLERHYAADLSLVRAEQGEIETALALSQRALELARELGNRREEGAAVGNTGARLNELRRVDEAREHYEHAIEILTEVGDRRAAAVFEAHIANMDLERLDTVSAKQRLIRALAVHREVGDWAWEGLVQGYLGHVALLEGRPREAASAYRDAGAILPGSYRRWAALVLAAQAVAEAKLGERAASAEHLASALRTMVAVGAPTDRVAWELFQALVRVVEARQDGDGERAESRARELLAHEAKGAMPDEVRFARALLERELSQESKPLSSQPTPAALVVAADGSWFESTRAGRVDLGRRAALRRLLEVLVRRRTSQPGKGLALDELFDAAWPGARIRAESRAARVYVAVGTLRKIGLGDTLLRQDDGYLLDPAVAVSVAEA